MATPALWGVNMSLVPVRVLVKRSGAVLVVGFVLGRNTENQDIPLLYQSVLEPAFEFKEPNKANDGDNHNKEHHIESIFV